MSIIKVKCTDQVLAFESTPVIASGGLRENFVEFTFCGQWTGFARTVAFWRSEKEVYHVLLDANDSAELPSEVTGEEGLIFFGVFGVAADGKQRTSEVLTYQIVKGAITAGVAPAEPTPDIYNQLLAKYAELASQTFAAGNVAISAETAETMGIDKTDPNVDDALVHLQEQVNECLPPEGDGGVVHYDLAQELAEEEKARARENIGAAAATAAIDGGAVMYDQVQVLPETQKARARSNIGAVSAAEVETAIKTALGDYPAALAALDAVIGGASE